MSWELLDIDVAWPTYGCTGGRLDHQVAVRLPTPKWKGTRVYCTRCGLVIEASGEPEKPKFKPNRRRYIAPNRTDISGSKRGNVLRKLRERDGNWCRYCGVEFGNGIDPTIDHVIPRALGGSNALINLALACEPCNRKKADHLEMPA